MKRIISFFAILCLLLMACGCSREKENKTYGLFLGVDETSFDDAFDRMKEFEVIVIDADALTDEQVGRLKDTCKEVYSYIDAGSLETYRSYYKRFEHLKLSPYEGWPDEFWADVSDENWQDFMVNEYAPSLIAKGIDGFFVDNLDVYYVKNTEEIYKGCQRILEGLKATGLKVIVNGADAYVSEHLNRNGEVLDILDGINQEIEDEIEVDFYKAYVEKMSECGAKIYITEYTDSEDISDCITSYCIERGFLIYVTENFNLGYVGNICCFLMRYYI